MKAREDRAFLVFILVLGCYIGVVGFFRMREIHRAIAADVAAADVAAADVAAADVAAADAK